MQHLKIVHCTINSLACFLIYRHVKYFHTTNNYKGILI